MVTIYTQPSCGPCIAVKRWFDKWKVPYKAVDVRQDPAGLARIRELGYETTPVIVAGEDHWNGFNPAKLESLKTS